MKRALNHFKKILKQNKLRLTRQREAIVKVFFARKGHVCVDELYYMLRKKHPNIGYTTVYRTIKLLNKSNMASEINFAGKRKRFEHAFEQPHHDHFICEVCGRIIEFVDPEIEKKQEVLCRKYKFNGERHLLQIFGICKVCKL